MIPDIGMIVGMEPQLCDTLSLILDESMHIEPVESNEPDWEDTLDFTASSSGRPDPEDDAPADAESKSNHCRTIPETLSEDNRK